MLMFIHQRCELTAAKLITWHTIQHNHKLFFLALHMGVKLGLSQWGKKRDGDSVWEQGAGRILGHKREEMSEDWRGLHNGCFITCTLHQLLRWSNHGVWHGWGMHHTWEKWNMNTKFWLGHLREEPLVKPRHRWENIFMRDHEGVQCRIPLGTLKIWQEWKKLTCINFNFLYFKFSYMWHLPLWNCWTWRKGVSCHEVNACLCKLHMKCHQCFINWGF